MTKKTIFTSLLLGLFFTSCNNLKKTTEETFIIASETKPCDAGIRKMNCMQVKMNKNQKDWENFYDEIEGFTYEKGYQYEIIVSKEKVENPTADASSFKYKLVKEVSKKKIEYLSLKDDNLIKMKWVYPTSSLFKDNNNIYSTTIPEITFTKDGKITGFFCNTINGTYIIPSANKIMLQMNEIKTSQQCESNVSLAENFLSSGEYEYDIMKGYLTLQNTKGETMTFSRYTTDKENPMAK